MIPYQNGKKRTLIDDFIRPSVCLSITVGVITGKGFPKILTGH